MAYSSIHKIGEAAYRIVKGGHPNNDDELRVQDFINYARSVFGDIVRTKFFEGKAEGQDFINGDFIFSFDSEEVKEDTHKNLYYSDLPASTITLPRDMGVFQVSLSQEQHRPFIPVANGFSGLYDGLLASNLEGRCGYYVEKNRIYFVNMEKKDGITEVMIKLVAPIGSLDEDEEFNVPDDMEKLIIDLTVQRYAPTEAIPSDNENDNVD